MKLVELAASDFDKFASTHPLRNYCQSSSYAKFMAEQGFAFEYIGYSDDTNNLVAASLMLYKKIGMGHKFAYAPKGFLIDYYNKDLLKKFVDEMVDRCRTKGVVFIKINPEIIIGELKAKKNFLTEANPNFQIIDELKDLKFKRRREIETYELLMPRFSPYINLKKYNEEKLAFDFKNYIKISKSRGLILEDAPTKEINQLYDLIKDHVPQEIGFYRNLLNIFNKDNLNDMADMLLVQINYREFLLQAQKNYDLEQDRNNILNEMMQDEANEENLELKMESDKLLLQLKDNIIEATEGLKNKEAQYIAGAIIIKYSNRISIIASGYDPDFVTIYPMHFLYSSIIEKYKDDYDYLDLNGYLENPAKDSVHQDLNEFKLGYKPNIYEFIGEFDIILDDMKFRSLQARDLVSTEIKKQRLNK